MVYVGSSYDKNAVLAIRFDGAHGDITGSEHVAFIDAGTKKRLWELRMAIKKDARPMNIR